MKKLFTILSVWMLGTVLVAQEVVLTYETHAYSTDEMNCMTLAEYVDPGDNGKDVVWDLSGMKNRKDFEGTVSASYEVDYENRFPESNVVLDEFGNKFYFNVEMSALTGYGMTSKDGVMAIKYDNPYVKMEYPFEFGDRIHRDYSGTVTISTQEYPVEGTYQVEADAFGKLILPDGSEHSRTLRIKTIQTYTMHFKQSRQTETVTYRWYSDRERYPLAVLLTTRTTSGERTTSSQKAAYKSSSQLSSVEEITNETEEAEVNVYPNPAKNHVTIDYAVEEESNVLIELYDNSGKKVTTLVNDRMQRGTYTCRFSADDESLTKGSYLIRSIIGNKTATDSFVRL